MKIKTKSVLLSNFRNGINGEVDEKLLPITYAVESYNFDFSSGVLKDGVGLKRASFKNSDCSLFGLDVERLYYYKKFFNGSYLDEILLYCQDGFVYSLKLGESNPTKIENLEFSSSPIGLNYRYNNEDIFIFSSEQGGLYVYDGREGVRVSCPEIIDACIHNERLYAILKNDTNRLIYSQDFNPLNFNVSLKEGGFIDFVDERGGLKKLVSCLGYLYIFRSYGISMLTGFFDQANFAVSHLFTSTGKIYPNSVTACQDGIIFLAKDGLYKLTGREVKKILSGYDNYLKDCNNEDCKGLYFNGDFYLKCKMKFEKEEDVILKVNLMDNTSYLSKNLKVQDLISITSESDGGIAIATKNGKTLYTFDKLCMVDNRALQKKWVSPTTTLGEDRAEKVIKNISLVLKGQVTVTIFNGISKTSFTLTGKGDRVEKRLSFRGKSFKFTLESSSINVEIAKPMITFSYF